MIQSNSILLAAEPLSPEESALKRLQQEQTQRPEELLFQRMVDQIVAFAATLDQGHEPALKPSGHSGSGVIRLSRLSLVLPDLMVFDGELETGEATRLIEHISQLNVLLVSVPRLDAGAPKRLIRIGP